jgi:hypothetical protein
MTIFAFFQRTAPDIHKRLHAFAGQFAWEKHLGNEKDENERDLTHIIQGNRGHSTPNRREFCHS